MFKMCNTAILFKTQAIFSSILAKKEISLKILSFAYFSLEKEREKKYNTEEYE